MDGNAKVINQLYDAAVGALPWTSAIDTLCREYGAVGAVAFSTMGRGSEYSIPICESLDKSYQDYLQKGWFKRDERLRGAPLFKQLQLFVDLDFVIEEEARKSAYYQEFLSGHGLCWSAVLALSVDGEPWALSVQRKIADGPFLFDDQKKLESLAPHLSRAITLHFAHERALAQGMLNTLDAISSAAFLLGPAGSVSGMNSTASALLGQGLTLIDGELSAELHEDSQRLQAMCRSAVPTKLSIADRDKVVVLRRAGQTPLLARVIPMREEAEMLLKQGRALLLIAEGQRQLPEDSKLLIEVFGFTPAEARMSAHLASGGSVTEYSNLRAMTLGSARQLAKHCLDRTGVHSQSQLVSLINGVQIARQKIGG